MSDSSLSLEALKKKLMVSILKYFQIELKEGNFDAENSEGLEVAMQCLESIYKVNPDSSDEPSILQVFKHYLATNVLHLPDPDEESKLEAENLKCQGNNAMSAGQFAEAITYYTRALKLNPKNAIYYCNRAAAYSKINNHRSAIKDCEMAIEIDGSYSKAYGRLGLAYTGLEDWKLAKEYYEIALSLDPKNESYMTNFQQAQKKLVETTSCPGGGGMPPPGAMPDLNSILQNRQLLNFASQMLTDPSMISAMSNIMSGSFTDPNSGAGGGNMATILEAGQQLASFIQNDNPQFMDELRQRIARAGPNQNADTNDAAGNNGDHPMEQDANQDNNPQDEGASKSNNHPSS